MKHEIIHTIFERGGENTAFAQYFVGQSYLNMLSTQGVAIGNVTFAPGCRNNWHIHHASKHWHGAEADSWFIHLAVEVPGEGTRNEWCEPVSDEEYSKLNLSEAL